MLNQQLLTTLLILAAICMPGITCASNLELLHNATSYEVLSTNYSEHNQWLRADVNRRNSDTNVNIESSNETSTIPNPDIHTILLTGLVISGLMYGGKNKKNL